MKKGCGGKNTTIYEKSWNKIRTDYPQIHRFFCFVKILMKDRKFLIWGASQKSDWFLRSCKLAKIEVAGYIDNDPELAHYRNISVYRPEILNPEDYFVFVALENRYSVVLCQMEECGMKEFQDYIYPSINPLVLTGNEREYFDLNGNEISGVVDGYFVEISKGSKLVVGKNCRIHKSVRIRLSQNAIFIIGDNCVIDSQCYISLSDSVCVIGSNSHISDYSSIVLQTYSVVFMGNDCDYGPFFKLRAAQSAICKIEKDCMFSENISVQCMDGHNYYDLSSKRNIGLEKKYTIHIGEHVWVGAKSNLFYGSDIGAGSIVGFGSFVKKKFPANTIIAGNPARVVRKHSAWIRKGYPFIQDYKIFEQYSFLDLESEQEIEENFDR